MRLSEITIPVFELLEARLLLDGATYYVDQSAAGASDSNPGTEAQPFLTIDRGVNLAQPGDTVLIKGSIDPASPSAIYDQSGRNGVDPVRPGLPGQPITIASYPG
ncbi:MAG: hypothetical protein NTX87_07380, partial [Planctomycetota bacterium]|nr:hypothetical protein [Planctomycetota bacterium]